MNQYVEMERDARENGCRMCAYEIEMLGPLQGPQPLPHPSVSRWSMTPAEWAGQEPLPERD